MSKFLIRSTEVYRIDSESEANNFIDQQKKKYEVSKYSSELKERKIKGEVADSWYRVTIVKTYNDEKEPENAFIEEDE
jgi:hypothetical protein